MSALVEPEHASPDDGPLGVELRVEPFGDREGRVDFIASVVNQPIGAVQCAVEDG